MLILGGVDYKDVPLVATFTTGDTSATVALSVTNDTEIEGDEQLHLMLNTLPIPGVSVELGVRSNSSATIKDSSKQITVCVSYKILVLCRRTTDGHSSNE